MSGPIVRTGATPEFWNNWDNVFGKKTKTSSKKNAASKTASKPAPQTAGKKATTAKPAVVKTAAKKTTTGKAPAKTARKK